MFWACCSAVLFKTATSSRPQDTFVTIATGARGRKLPGHADLSQGLIRRLAFRPDGAILRLHCGKRHETLNPPGSAAVWRYFVAVRRAGGRRRPQVLGRQVFGPQVFERQVSAL